jgi:hypothetical protein
MLKEAVAANYNPQGQHFPGGTEKRNKKCQSGLPMAKLKF